MDSQTHAQVKVQTKQVRAAAARGRRATWAGSTAPVVLVAATLDGTEVLFAHSPAEGDRAHILRRDGGVWRCRCFAAVYSVARTCRHEEAARGWALDGQAQHRADYAGDGDQQREHRDQLKPHTSENAAAGTSVMPTDREVAPDGN